MQPGASTGPSGPPTCPAAQPVGTRRGSCATSTPTPAATAGSHFVQSNSGYATLAVVVSSTASPPSAWFAIAVAGQNAAASGAVACAQRRKLTSSPVSAGLPVLGSPCPRASP